MGQYSSTSGVRVDTVLHVGWALTGVTRRAVKVRVAAGITDVIGGAHLTLRAVRVRFARDAQGGKHSIVLIVQTHQTETAMGVIETGDALIA